MRIEDHVPALETCQRMAELGWKKETLLWWRNDYPKHTGKYLDRWYIEKDYPYTHKPQRAIKYDELWHLLPAPLATEIMEELPDRMVFDGKQCQLVISDNHVSYQEVVADPVVDRNLQRIVYAPAPIVSNVIEELSTMWIYLKENDLLPDKQEV